MDPANILSLLQGQAPVQPANVLQTIMGPSPEQVNNGLPGMDASPPAPSPVMAAANAASPPMPKKRRSLLDTIGRISDVLATVGGAQALYQPTLDAREDRSLALGDHDRKVNAEEIALATNKFALGDAQNVRLGQAARGLQAIKASGGDITKAWPVIAQRMQLDPATVESVGQALATNPTALDGLIAATTDPKYDQSKYGGSVVYGKDANGNLVAYQPSLGNDSARNILPDGVTPIDPLKFVDTGNAQVGVGTRSGSPVRILPKSATPDARLGANTRLTISREGNVSRERTAAMKSGTNKAGDPAMIETAQGNLDELRGIYNDLNRRGAMVSPKQAADKNVVARIRASGIGQTLEGAVGTEAQTQRDRIASIRPQLMQSLAKATGMTGKQLDSNADVKLFMQTVTNPAASYEANMAAIDGLERFLKANAKKPVVAPRSTPVRPRPKANSGGWSIVGVK
jgi:hypothetical protein